MTKKLRIALVGNPNTGKSSVFNALTGLNQKIANFPGVTVEKSTGYFKMHDTLVEVTDLPGAYSLFPKSADEAVPYEVLLNTNHSHHPDLVVFVADASNLKRNLVLLTQIIDLRLPTILVLNMADQAEAQGIKIDLECLSAKFGIPVVSTNARKKQGIHLIIDKIKEGGAVSSNGFFEENEADPANKYLQELESSHSYQAVLKLHKAVKALAAPAHHVKILFELQKNNLFDSGTRQREDLLYRYKRITEILSGCVTVDKKGKFNKRQDQLDAVLTHKFWGYIIFFITLFIIFQAIFVWARYPMELISTSFSYLSSKLSAALPEGILNDLLSNGILAGLSGVIVFIPQIAFLFFFISIMEETGYLARVAFLMDRIMRRFGMNGKSVVPLISGTACAVPAIMATRSIENRNARLVTILVTPLMSCSARLPVYILLISMIVPFKSFFYGILNMQGVALMGLYVLGFAAAMGGALLFSTLIEVKNKQYFFLELPVYRAPNWSNIGYTVYNKVKSFVAEAGKIIIAISIILWFLASYGPPGKFAEINEKYQSKEVVSTMKAEEIQQHIRTEKLENSYAGKIGHAIEPAIRPLGYDWKIGIALITSFAAREVFVGTVATIYGLEGDNPDYSKLKENMQKSKDAQTGLTVYTTATVLSLLIFYVFAMQCMSTIAVTYKETRSAKWTFIQFFYMSGLAYVSSLIIYQVLK